MHRTDSTIGYISKTQNGNLIIKSSPQTESFAICDADDGKVDTGEVGTGTEGAVAEGVCFSDPSSDALIPA